MKIINRYFSRQLIVIFVMLMLVLTGLAWMVQVMSMMKFLLNYGVELGGFVGLTALMIPFIASIIIPFGAFIATIFVYNRLIADNEVTVLAASGMAPKQIARPAMILACALALCHLCMNVWIVPATQAKFYDTQWELRYGLAHMKLQESAFTQMADGLVVYVDKVSGHDLSQLMLSDSRNIQNQITVFANRGKLVATTRGLSIIMDGGSLLVRDATGTTVGTFDTFDMDMNVADGTRESAFKVRRIPTSVLIAALTSQKDAREHKQAIGEIGTRFLGPVMNIILVGLCVLILLRSSLLRRRASIAPIIAVASMAGAMALFMSATNMISSITDLAVLAAAQMLVLMGIIFALTRK